MAPMSEQRVTYRFGPLERRGILGPVRGGQAAILGAGLLLAVTLLDRAPSALGAVSGMATLAVSILLTTIPVGRRTADEWGPVLAVFMLRRFRGRGSHRSAAPRAGDRVRIEPRGAAKVEHVAADPPPALRGVQIVQLPYRDRPVGAISERAGRRLTVVLACRVPAFGLLDPEAQERRLARWGLVLAGAAGSAVRRIGWVERTLPARGDELARWLHDERDPEVPLRGTPMIESYLELIGSSARVSQEHQILLAVQVDAGRVSDRGRDACAQAAVEESERVAERLRAAEIGVLGALSPGQLSRVLRTAFDPFAAAELAALDAADPERSGLPVAAAWPVGTEESWDRYRCDGAEHATYWIGGWPRVDVSPLFMDALLGRSTAVRTVAVTFEPLDPVRSTREVEAAVTRDRADRELRRRFGQSETARQRQVQEATMRRESELAAGHCEVRLAGFVTVSGRDAEELRRAGGEVLEQGARARIELHRMFGQQAEAFTFTLPLCRGLA
jgi:Putative type VII ESX secretion system translocon, EccE